MADYTQPDVVPKRVRFFDGQFLKEQDFIDEQKFHLDRERRQSRLLRLTGVCSGLAVTSGAAFQIAVTGGMAVDGLGRHLVLAADTPLALGAGFANQQGIEVHLAYRESATDVEVSARRWDESPKIVVVAPNGTTAVAPGDAAPELDDPTVLLGRLAVAGNGDVTVDAGTAQRSSLSVSGALGVGTTEPGSDLDIGGFDPQDRHLTFKVAGGDQYRGGIRLWAGAEHQGYSVEYDQRPVAGHGLHVRTHDQDPEGTTRLFVATGGDIGIGTTAPVNDGGWGRVVDLLGPGSAKLSVRTTSVDARVLAHDQGVFGAPAGMVVGTATPSPLSLATNGAARLSVTSDGHLGIGTTAPLNDAGWSRVVDIYGGNNAKLSVRTSHVDARVLAHDQGVFGAPAGMVVGTATASPLSLATNGTSRLTIGASGGVSIGDYNNRGARLAVHASDGHLKLIRAAAKLDNPDLLSLEFLQDHSDEVDTTAIFNLRFAHTSMFSYRMAVAASGFHFKRAWMTPEDDVNYIDAHMGRLSLHGREGVVPSLTLGETTIGEKELKVLKKLANNQLVCELRNHLTNSYIWDSTQKRGDGPYFYALTWIPGQPVASHTHTFWKFEVSDK